jgi:hypothetical protein
MIPPAVCRLLLPPIPNRELLVNKTGVSRH